MIDGVINVIQDNLPDDSINQPVNEGGQIDYGKLIEESSKEIVDIPDEYNIFISHASNGEGAHPDEKQFVLALYKFLDANYPGRVYLDLIKNPSIIYTEVIGAAVRSTYGVFICSPRYIKIFNGKRKEPFVREFDTISLELNVFFQKQRNIGFCMVPVRFGVTPEAYTKSPFPGVNSITIEDETSKTHLQKAEYVSLQIIEMIKKAELNQQVST